jgi:Ice-binding-like
VKSGRGSGSGSGDVVYGYYYDTAAGGAPSTKPASKATTPSASKAKVPTGKPVKSGGGSGSGGSMTYSYYGYGSGGAGLSIDNSCRNFTVLAGSSITSGTDKTTISRGFVGVSPGTVISSNLILNRGAIKAKSADSKACSSELLTLIQTGMDTTCENNLADNDLSGMTLSAGTYCSETNDFTTSASGILTLDAKNVPSAVWIFQMSGDLTTGASTRVLLKNGALASNVFWVVGGNAVLGMSSTMTGNVLSKKAISLGSAATVNGRLLAHTQVSFTAKSNVVQPADNFGRAVTGRRNLRSSPEIADTSEDNLSQQ